MELTDSTLPICLLTIYPTFAKTLAMIFKILLWAIIGYIVYSWFKEKLNLKQGENKTTEIHHHHYNEDKKRGKGDDSDYIDYEELK
jgi:hypothetical protein